MIRSLHLRDMIPVIPAVVQHGPMDPSSDELGHLSGTGLVEVGQTTWVKIMRSPVVGGEVPSFHHIPCTGKMM